MTLTARWIAEPQVTEHTITIVSDPEPPSIRTSAGTVVLTDGSATIYGGTIIHEPQLTRDRQILHRWTDQQGNTYDWTRPVTRDLVLTADWREHFTVSVEGNRATVTMSPDLPSAYVIYQVVWDDGTTNDRLTHVYAAPGEHTITVRSGAHDTWVASSSTITIEEMPETAYHTITFDTAGGSAVPDRLIEHGDTMPRPKDPARDGYEFVGWYRAGILYDWTGPVTGDMVLSAAWLPITPGDDDDDDEAPANNMLLIALTILTIMSLAITLLTRSPYAFGLTVVLALIEIALLALGITGVIA